MYSRSCSVPLVLLFVLKITAHTTRAKADQKRGVSVGGLTAPSQTIPGAPPGGMSADAGACFCCCVQGCNGQPKVSTSNRAREPPYE